MQTILHLNTIIFGDDGQSSRLAKQRAGAILSSPTCSSLTLQSMIFRTGQAA